MGDALSIERGQGLVEVRGEPMTGFLHVQRVWAGAALHMERTGARVDWRVTGSLGALEEGDRIDYEGAYFEVEAAGAWRPHHDVFCGDRLRSPPDPGTFHRSGSLSLDPEYRDASRRHRLVLQVIPRVRRRLVERYAVAAVVPPDSAGESPH